MTIFGIIFSFLLFLFFTFQIKKIIDETFGSIILSFCLVIVALFLFGIFGSINSKYEKENTFGVTYINSLSINSGVSGNFCLGTGTIEQNSYYYFVLNKKFGYQVSKIKNDGNVYIKEDGNKNPFIEYTRYKCVYHNWFSKLFFKKSVHDKDGEIIIHVPKNTVVKNYNVDISKL